MSVKRDLQEATAEVEALFQQLMALPTQSESFYHMDQQGLDGATYRIFLYRLGSYSDFCLPGALEARGITYRHNVESDVWELVSRPMTKFFNWGENPFTMGIDLRAIEYATVKEDGSLISTYTDQQGVVCLKTKGSLHSEQAKAATAWLTHNSRAEFCKILADLDKSGWTVNCEWTSPLNRIVISYQTDKLIVLNARHRLTGAYMERAYMEELIPVEYLVPISDLMVEDVADAVGTEGLVAFFGNGANPVEFMKVKADAYQRLHRLKDGVNQPNALYDAVIGGQIDDLRSSFVGDPAVQLMIAEMETLVLQPFNHFAAVCERLYEKHKHLEKKEFVLAVKADVENEDGLYSKPSVLVVAINLYVGRDPKFEYSFTYAAKNKIVAMYKANVVAALTAAQLTVESEDV